jgi:hypothetical protein
MKRFISLLLTGAIFIGLMVVSSCSGGTTGTTSNRTTMLSNVSTSGAATTSGLLRSENWLLGAWEATVPNTESSIFAGKKINIEVNSVMLVSDEQVQGKPTGKYAYSGTLIWDVDGEAVNIDFLKENRTEGNGTLVWSYASPGANQFMENISMRIYDLQYAIELDWGPQISKPGSNYKTLEFYGSIQNVETSDRNVFDPDNMIKFTQTSSTAPTTTATKPTTNTAGSSTTKTSTTVSEPSSTDTTAIVPGTGDIWSDIPVYPNAHAAEDSGFEMSVGGDESFSQIEWRFYATSDDYTGVVDFYKEKMPANGWTKMMWLDSEEMSYGSFQKNNETKLCLVYVVNSEGDTGINIQSAAK